MAEEKAAQDNPARPDPKTAELTHERANRFIWHPDDIMVVVRGGKEIPPTRLSDLVAQERSEAEAKKVEEKKSEE